MTQPDRRARPFPGNFLAESWLEHLRQHERVTHADRVVEEQVRRHAREAPRVTHFIAARAGETGDAG